MHDMLTNNGKIQRIGLCLASQHPNLAPYDCWIFVAFKKMLQGKKFFSNEEVITETEVYFEANKCGKKIVSH